MAAFADEVQSTFEILRYIGHDPANWALVERLRGGGDQANGGLKLPVNFVDLLGYVSAFLPRRNRFLGQFQNLIS